MSHDSIAIIKSQYLLPDIVAKYDQVKQVGKHYFTRCLWHEDSSPSLCLYQHKYYCFACGAKGDAIDYVMKAESIGVQQAINRILDKEAPPLIAEQKEEAYMSTANLEEIADTAHQNVQRILPYLASRGVSTAQAYRYKLGATDRGDLTVPVSNGSETVAILIRKSNGKPKYKLAYKSPRFLGYGVINSDRTGQPIVTEGFLDAISLDFLGSPVYYTLGIKKPPVSNAVCGFDWDAAGFDGLVRYRECFSDYITGPWGSDLGSSNPIGRLKVGPLLDGELDFGERTEELRGAHPKVAEVISKNIQQGFPFANNLQFLIEMNYPFSRVLEEKLQAPIGEVFVYWVKACKWLRDHSPFWEKTTTTLQGRR